MGILPFYSGIFNLSKGDKFKVKVTFVKTFVDQFDFVKDNSYSNKKIS